MRNLLRFNVSSLISESNSVYELPVP